GHAGGLLDQLGRGRRLGDELERPVFEDRDLDGDDVAPLGFGGSVVLLAEVHDVDTVRAELGTAGQATTAGSCTLTRAATLFLLGGIFRSFSSSCGVRGCGRQLRFWRPARRRARPESPGRRSTPAP